MKVSQLIEDSLKKEYSWLVTGVAGFIGSHIAEELLRYNQKVIGLDNFITGNKDNISLLESSKNNRNFSFLERDISLNEEIIDLPKVDFVIHQAALGSVPRSIKFPIDTHANNVTGFINVIDFARRIKAKKIIYASSSSVYGDDLTLPKRVGNEGNILSPYASSKLINEIYSSVYALSYGINCIGLRYFNVFGPRQDPMGEYAAVIPKWIKLISENKEIEIFGDGETTRDFCYVKNAVQANLLAALVTNKDANNRVYNVACGDSISLNFLASEIAKEIQKDSPNISLKSVFKDFRKGDIRHSLADISETKKFLGFNPTHTVKSGLSETIKYFFKKNDGLK